MAEHEALVEISLGRRTFKFSGSEAFVEKMIDAIPTLLPINGSQVEEEEPLDDNEASRGGSSGREHETIDEFIERLNITDAVSEIRKVSAFVFFLTEIAKHKTCTTAQIEECFDLTGLKTPKNLITTINDASKARNGSYVRSVSRGNYAVTTNGKNLVKEMTQGK